MKSTIEQLVGLSNEQIYALTDAEIDEYLAEALTVQTPQVQAAPGRTSINTSARPRTSKHMGPSALAQQLLSEAQNREQDAELAAMIAETTAKLVEEKKNRPRI